MMIPPMLLLSPSFKDGGATSVFILYCYYFFLSFGISAQRRVRLLERDKKGKGGREWHAAQGPGWILTASEENSAIFQARFAGVWGSEIAQNTCFFANYCSVVLGC